MKIKRKPLSGAQRVYRMSVVAVSKYVFKQLF